MWLDWNKRSNSGPLGHLANQQGFWQWFLQFLSVFYIHKSCSIYPSSFFGKYIDRHGRSWAVRLLPILTPPWVLPKPFSVPDIMIMRMTSYHINRLTFFLGFAGSKPPKKKQRKAAWGFVPAFFSVCLLPTTVLQRLTEWNRNTKGTCWTCQHFPAAFCDRKLRVVHTALNVCFVYFKVRITVNAYQGKIGSLLALTFSIESLMKLHHLSWYWLGWSCHVSIQKNEYLFEKRAAGAAREC